MKRLVGILGTSVKQRRREEGSNGERFRMEGGFRLETYLVYASLCTHAPSLEGVIQRLLPLPFQAAFGPAGLWES